MRSLGIQCILELTGCDSKILKDLDLIKNALISAAKDIEAIIVEISFHRFSSLIVSGVVLTEEEYITFHAWPEYSRVAADIFTSYDDDRPEQGVKLLKIAFKSGSSSVLGFKRGVLDFNEKHPQEVKKEITPVI